MCNEDADQGILDILKPQKQNQRNELIKHMHIMLSVIHTFGSYCSIGKKHFCYTVIVIKMKLYRTISEHHGTDGKHTFQHKSFATNNRTVRLHAHIKQLHKYNSHHICCILTELTTL